MTKHENVTISYPTLHRAEQVLDMALDKIFLLLLTVRDWRQNIPARRGWGENSISGEPKIACLSALELRGVIFWHYPSQNILYVRLQETKPRAEKLRGIHTPKTPRK